MTDFWTRNDQISFEQERGVTAIRIERGFAHVLITCKESESVNEAALKLMKAMHDNRLSVNLLTFSEEYLSFLVAQSDLPTLKLAVTPLGYQMEARTGYALLGVYAANMRETIGVMAKIAEALLHVDAKIEQTGDSHDRVMIVIQEDKLDVGIEALQNAFNLEVSPV